MDLFETDDQPITLFEKQGKVIYYPNFFSSSESEFYFSQLFDEITWQSDRVFIYGKEILTKRKFCWMGDKPFSYGYSKCERFAIPWNKHVLEIKNLLENTLAKQFNSCLLNRYLDGSEGMGWHADNESCMLKGGTIASISFGDIRTMEFKHNLTKEKVKIQLENGSLLVMLNETQDFWQHQITKTTRSKNPRVNLTFRTFVEIM